MANDGFRLDRRLALGGLGLAALASAAGSSSGAQAKPVQPGEGSVRIGSHDFRIVDLTHKLTEAFSWGMDPPRLAMEGIDGSGKDAGMHLNRLSLVEHTGTHIDAPSHFGEGGADLADIPLQDLAVPLVVVDARERARSDGNFALSLKDLQEWEGLNGPIPLGCCVALWSGIDPLEEFQRVKDSGGIADLRAPGFAPATADWLAQARKVKGVAVDSMTLDNKRQIPSYPFHRKWLRDGRWGIEGIANLNQVPATGALLIAGAAPIKGATGMPIRAIAIC